MRSRLACNGHEIDLQPHDSRTINCVSRTIDRRGRPESRKRSSNNRAPAAPMSRAGCATTVRGGLSNTAEGVSPNPTSAISLGISVPRSRRASKAPRTRLLLTTKMALGLFPTFNTFDTASKPAARWKNSAYTIRSRGTANPASRKACV
jgi:hypothetical protein